MTEPLRFRWQRPIIIVGLPQHRIQLRRCLEQMPLKGQPDNLFKTTSLIPLILAAETMLSNADIFGAVDGLLPMKPLGFL